MLLAPGALREIPLAASGFGGVKRGESPLHRALEELIADACVSPKVRLVLRVPLLAR